MEGSLKKGKDINNAGDFLKQSLNTASDISNFGKITPQKVLNAVLGFASGAKETISDKDKDALSKVLGISNSAVSKAIDMSGASGKELSDAVFPLVGAINKNADKKVKNIRETINKPAQEMQEDFARDLQNYNGLQQTLAQGINAATNMAPALATAAITKNPNLSMAIMANNVKGQATEEALRQGKSLEEAREIGNTKAGAEVLTELMTGGLNIFGKGALDDVAEQTLNKVIKNPTANFIANKALGIAGENLEESASNILGKAIDKGTVDPNAKLTMEDITEPWGATTVSSLLLNGLSGGYTPKAYRDYTSQMKVQNLNDVERAALTEITNKRLAGQQLDDNDIATINYLNNKDSIQNIEQAQPNEKVIQPTEETNNPIEQKIANQNIKDNVNNNIAEEKAKDNVIVAKNSSGKEIKLKQNKDTGIYTREDNFNRDLKDINQQFKNQTIAGKNGQKISNFYSNITEKSKFIDTDIRNMFKNENDIKFYNKVTNEESLNKANAEIGNTAQSQEKAFNDFISRKEQFDATDMAKGWIFLSRFNEARDYDRAYLVAKQMREMGTKSGQAIQMLNLQSRLTPEGMYRWAVNELMEAENKFNSEKGRTKQEIEKYRDSFRLTDEETEFIKNQMEKIQDMPQGREKDIELAKINSMLQNKLPHQKGQSLKSWMRISMLFNPKTQVRNVMGNTIITPVNAVSDVFASGVDKLISKKTGKRTIGAPSLGGLVSYGKGALQGIKEATQDYKLGIDTKNINQDRFDVGQGKAFNENHRGPLKGLRNKVAKGLNATNDLLGYVMDVGDRAFYQGSVENSLYNQQKINNTKEITNEMREIAENEGLQRTWNDNNEYTKAVLDLRRSINKIGDQMHIHVGEYGLGDLLIPFAKTPANLTKAIVDYSPVGFVNAITEGKNLKNAIETGNYTPQMQHDFSQTIGKATAGTLLYALGTILAKANITTGNSDEDKDLKNFMRYNLGIQPYSIKIGDKSFTYDWAQPIAAPFAITADVQKGMQENMTPGQAVQHFLTTGFNILSEQSFLSGINEVLNDNDGILSGMEQQIINLPATAMPTLLKQITDMFDGTKRQTYSKEGQIENMKKVAKSKDPVGSKQLAPQVDVLGNEIEKYGGDNNAFNVFLNPANTEKGKKTPVAEEIYSLYEATQDKTIIPRKVDYSTKINGKNKTLTTQEMEKWQKASGKLVTQEVERAMNSSEYQNMNDEQKAKVINKIVNYSYQKAKSNTFDTPLANTYNGVEKAQNKGIPIADYYISTVLKSSK